MTKATKTGIEFIIRPLRGSELETATALCLRSKAYWGYDAAFMAACVDELTLKGDDLDEKFLFCAAGGDQIYGVGQVAVEEGAAYLEKLFVDPACIRCGAGKALYEHAVLQATEQGFTALVIVADPYAVAFYERQGAVVVGETPSLSIPGRVLPRMIHSFG